MQDFRSRIGRTLSIFVTLYLIQAISLSTVYAAVIDTSFSPVRSSNNSISLAMIRQAVIINFSNFTSTNNFKKETYFNKDRLINSGVSVKTPYFSNFSNANHSQTQVRL